MEIVRVLHIAECGGGVERYLQLLMPLLKKMGVKQSFICSLNYNPQLYIRWNDRVEQMNYLRSFSVFHVVSNIIYIRKIIKEIHPDILYCHSTFAGVQGRLAAIGLSCKVIYNPHGWSFNMK